MQSSFSNDICKLSPLQMNHRMKNKSSRAFHVLDVDSCWKIKSNSYSQKAEHNGIDLIMQASSRVHPSSFHPSIPTKSRVRSLCRAIIPGLSRSWGLLTQCEISVRWLFIDHSWPNLTTWRTKWNCCSVVRSVWMLLRCRVWWSVSSQIKIMYHSQFPSND